jgi:hypothetical protein
MKMELIEQWDTALSQFPKWGFGGQDIELDEYPDDDGGSFYALQMCGVGYAELEQYRQLLKQNGFVTDKNAPSDAQLYKRIDGVGFCFDSEDPFAAGEGNLCVSFRKREPQSW